MNAVDHDLLAGEAPRPSIVDRLPIGLIEVGHDGQVTLLNDEARRLTGTGDGSAIDPDLRARLLHVVEAVSAEHPTAELSVRTSTPGREADLLLTTRLAPDGTSGRGLVTVHDVTEHRRFDGELNRTHRIDALNHLAGVVARDIDKLLTIILGYTELAIGSAAKGQGTERDLAVVRSSTQRARNLTDRLHTLSGSQVVRAVPLDPTAWVRERSELLAHLVEPADLRVVDDPFTPWVRIDPAQLEQIVVQLANNGREAITGDGTVTIALAPGVLGDGGPAAVIRVTDDGVGMDADTLARCVEPLFSTKPIGDGAGLGLAIVQAAAAQAGGEVHISSVPGVGTTVAVVLPAADRHGARTDQAHRSASTPERVLVVVEADGPRREATDTLTRAGFRVSEATSATVALRQIAGGLRPDAVVAEMVQVGADGPAFADRIRELLPQIPVVLLAGRPGPGSHPMAGLTVVDGPDRIERLAPTVRQALADQATPVGQGSKR